MCPSEDLSRSQSSLAVDSQQPGEERFRLIVESIKDYAIFMLDLQGRITTWNTGAERINGYAAPEILGRHFGVFYPPADAQASRGELALAEALREGRFEEEALRVRKGGSLFWANVVITVVHDPSGRPSGYVKVVRDLSERRRVEEERLRLAQEREANRVKDEFLAMISHELRTPLMAILGWSTLLQTRITDQESAKALQTIRRNAQAQARIIDDILDLSDVITGKLRIDAQAMDMRAVVEEAIATAKPLAEAKRLNLVEALPARVPMLGDSARLQHVVWNILSNAIKFTPSGGQVELALERDGEFVRLTVRDSGRGIEPAFLPHVFTPFRQADVSSTRAVGGLGLGLALVHRIVELHGGEVSIHSPGADQGTTVELRLPAGVNQPGRAPESKPSSPLPARALEGLRVLIVDDEADARDLLTTLLARHGAQVEAADSAQQARQLLAQARPDVLLSDIGMPDEDGYNFMRSVRALPQGRGGDTPAVALTAYTRPDDRRRAFDAGFNGHLAKPVDPQELLRVIRGLSRAGASAPG
jgi:PAS domain S-box-containing protein